MDVNKIYKILHSTDVEVEAGVYKFLWSLKLQQYPNICPQNELTCLKMAAKARMVWDALWLYHI